MKKIKVNLNMFLLFAFISSTVSCLAVDRYDDVIKERDLELREELRHQGRNRLREKDRRSDRHFRYRKYQRWME